MIRSIDANDRALFIMMSEEFYDSPAVLHPVPRDVHLRTFDEMMTSSRYTEGYMFELDGWPAGYAILSRSFSSEVGGMVLWIEEVFVRTVFQGRGLGKAFLEFVRKKARREGYMRVRLEVESDNERAAALYEQMGFTELGYRQMVRDIEPLP